MQQKIFFKEPKKSAAELEAEGFAKIDAKSQKGFFQFEEKASLYLHNLTANPQQQKSNLTVIDEYGYYIPKW